MNQLMIVWCVTVAVLLSAFVLREMERLSAGGRNSARKRGHLIEMGNERDMFYIPGDIEDDDFLD